MQARHLVIVVGIAAALGFLFSSVSAYDFTQHLDREIHGVHCSFIPGLGRADISGSSGCQTAMMSPWSSMFRRSVWGGLPIALPSMGVFAFLLFFAVDLLLSRRTMDRQLTGLLTIATGVPVLASIIMGGIAIAELGALCKLCVGIYASSFAACGAAAMAWRGIGARNRFAELAAEEEEPVVDENEGPTEMGGGPHAPAVEVAPPGSDVVDAEDLDDESEWPAPLVSPGHVGALVAAGVLFVAVPSLAYVATAPDHSSYVIGCGTLDRPGDLYRVMVPMGPQTAAVNAVEILDPLCPACAAFEERLEGTGLASELSRQVLLFPLEASCNWMVDSAVHPGACTVSEAVLCAGDRADEVLRWAFDNGDMIRTASKDDPKAARRMVLEAFGSLRSCLGSPAIKTKLNKSLRWAVRNRLQILTPQLYIEGVRLCDEDVDLGLEFALTRMLEMRAAGTLPKVKARSEPARFIAPEPETPTNEDTGEDVGELESEEVADDESMAAEEESDEIVDEVELEEAAPSIPEPEPSAEEMP